MKEFGKNLMIRKKGSPLDEKETFCNIIDLLEETILRSEKVYDEINIDMINYEENFYLIIENMFPPIVNKNLDFYLFDLLISKLNKGEYFMITNKSIHYKLNIDNDFENKLKLLVQKLEETEF